MGGEEQEEMEGEEEPEVVVDMVGEVGEEEDMVVEAMETMEMEEGAERTPGMVLGTVAGVGAHHLVLLAPHLHPTILAQRVTTPPLHTADTAVTETRVG